DLVRKGPAALRDDDLALLEKLVGSVDGLVQQPAGVLAQVDEHTLGVGAELVQRLLHLMGGGLHELRDVDVADIRLDQERYVNGVAGNLVADEIEDERLRAA